MIPCREFEIGFQFDDDALELRSSNIGEHRKELVLWKIQHGIPLIRQGIPVDGSTKSNLFGFPFVVVGRCLIIENKTGIIIVTTMNPKC